MTTQSSVRLPPPLVCGEDGVVVDVSANLGWLVDELRAGTQEFVTAHYNDADLTLLLSGVDAFGERLPAHAAKAAQRLGWTVTTSHSRVGWMMQSEGLTVLRGQAWRNNLFGRILLDQNATAGTGLSTTGDAVAQRLGETANVVTVRAMLRSITTFTRREQRAPQTYFDVFPNPPHANPTLNLGVTDSQYATRTVEGDTFVVHLRLPTTPHARTAKEHGRFTFAYRIPHHALERFHGAQRVTLPRYRDGQWYTTLVEVALPYGDPNIVVGVDYGINKPLLARVTRYEPDTDTYVADGYPFEWEHGGLLDKSLRLQQESQQLAGRIARLTPYLTGLDPTSTDHKRLTGRLEMWKQAKGRVNRKRARIHRDMSHDVADWIHNICRTFNASAVFTEDLSSMPANIGKTNNRVLSQFPRNTIMGYLTHRLAREGITHLAINPRNTSKLCPQCLNPLTHTNWVNASCAACGVRDHRDHLAAVRIGQRGHAVRTRARTRGGRRSQIIVDKPVRLSRTKTGPTPSQVRKAHTKHRTFTKVRGNNKPHPRSARVFLLDNRSKGLRPSLTTVLSDSRSEAAMCRETFANLRVHEHPET